MVNHGVVVLLHVQLVPSAVPHNRFLVSSYRDVTPVPEELHASSQSSHALYHLGTLCGQVQQPAMCRAVTVSNADRRARALVPLQFCPVSSCAVSISLGLVATGGRDGSVVLAELRKCRVMNVLHTSVCRWAAVSGVLQCDVIASTRASTAPVSACKGVHVRVQMASETASVTHLCFSEPTTRLVVAVWRCPRAPAQQDRAEEPEADVPTSEWFFGAEPPKPPERPSVPSTPSLEPSHALMVFSLQGVLLGMVSCKSAITSMFVTANGEFVVCGDVAGVITVRSVGDLQAVVTYPVMDTAAPTLANVCMAEGERFMFCGANECPLMVITDPATTVRALQSRLKDGLFGLS